MSVICEKTIILQFKTLLSFLHVQQRIIIYFPIKQLVAPEVDIRI